MTTTLEYRREQAHEARMRRLATRNGYRLHKLRGDNGYGYWLFDTTTNVLVIGEEIARRVRIGHDLSVIEEFLT
jgi:hypothetical protein